MNDGMTFYKIVDKDEYGVFGAFDTEKEALNCIEHLPIENEKSVYYGAHIVKSEYYNIPESPIND